MLNIKEDKIYKISAMAEILWLHPWTLTRKCQQGNFPCINIWLWIRKSYRIKWEDVINLINKGNEKRDNE